MPEPTSDPRSSLPSQLTRRLAGILHAVHQPPHRTPRDVVDRQPHGHRPAAASTGSSSPTGTDSDDWRAASAPRAPRPPARRVGHPLFGGSGDDHDELRRVRPLRGAVIDHVARAAAHGEAEGSVPRDRRGHVQLDPSVGGHGAGRVQRAPAERAERCSTSARSRSTASSCPRSCSRPRTPSRHRDRRRSRADEASRSESLRVTPDTLNLRYERIVWLPPRTRSSRRRAEVRRRTGRPHPGVVRGNERERGLGRRRGHGEVAAARRRSPGSGHADPSRGRAGRDVRPDLRAAEPRSSSRPRSR